MPDILVRGLDEQTIKRLKARAKRHGRSLQSEARLAIENAAGLSIDEMIDAGRHWRKKLKRKFNDSTRLIRRDRQR